MTPCIFSHLVFEDEKIQLSFEWKNFTYLQPSTQYQRDFDFRKNSGNKSWQYCHF